MGNPDQVQTFDIALTALRADETFSGSKLYRYLISVLLVYELAQSATALATSRVESLPPSPQPARCGGASPCRRGDRTCFS